MENDIVVAMVFLVMFNVMALFLWVIVSLIIQ